MGPPSRRRTRSAKNSRIPIQKQKQKIIDEEKLAISPCKSPCQASLEQCENTNDGSNSACSTPKAERFRIPEIKTCPPAPKKRRILSSSSSNCHSLRRTPITFFAPPDLELFFFFASLRDIPV